MSFEISKEGNSDQADNLGSPQPDRARKPYTKPLVQTVVINSKNEVLGTNCFTSVQTSQQPGNGCRLPTPICFS